jgi:ribonuclease-3
MSALHFRDAALLELARTHASTNSERNNERLELLGDAALALIVVQQLYERCPGLDEGELSERKARLVSRITLARAARMAGLEDHAQLGNGMQRHALPVSVQANLYEALLGALLLDQGFEAARAFVLETLAEDLELEQGAGAESHPKQTLQQWAQARALGLPQYALLEERGAAHAKAFRVCARIQGEEFPAGWGRTLREAESRAAHEALLVLRARGLLP